MTDPEERLWFQLRNNRLQGLKFRRQHPIGPFIADFACSARMLVVELDGSQHSLEVDANRTRFLEARGWRVLRFWNFEVLRDEQLVLEETLRVALGR